LYHSHSFQGNFLKQKKLPTQHTPNPEAQVPEAVPPFVVHSALVKHVP
jgi:hypothetical protein